MSFIQEGGILMWPLLLIGLAIIIIAVQKVNDLYLKTGLSQARLEKGINSVIFWGSFSLILGFFAHFMGLYQAMIAISRIRTVSPQLVAGGYAVSLITILTGLVIFMFSAILWIVFRARYKKLTLITK